MMESSQETVERKCWYEDSQQVGEQAQTEAPGYSHTHYHLPPTQNIDWSHYSTWKKEGKKKIEGEWEKEE